MRISTPFGWYKLKRIAIQFLIITWISLLIFQEDVDEMDVEVSEGRFETLLGQSPGFIKNTKIPKFIHQTWKTADLKQQSTPSHVIQSVNAWSQESPGYTYLLWNDADIQNLVFQYYPHLRKLYRKLTPVMRADLFRLLVLHKYGGIVSLRN